MGRVNNLKASKLSPLKTRIRRTEMTNALDSGSVDNGTTTYRGNESLRIVGSAVVSGWLIITGTLKLVGNLLMEGAATFTGSLTAAGAALFTGAFTSRGTTRFEGDTSQLGQLHIVGATDLTGDLHVDGAGRIYVGTSMVLDPSIASGAIVFSNGAQLFTNADEIEMFKSQSAVSVRDLKVVIASPKIEMSAADLHLFTLPTKTGTGAPAGLLWTDAATGRIYRTV